MSDLKYSFAIDRGGTFTDVYCEIDSSNGKKTQILKLLSEHTSYSNAPTEAIRQIISENSKINIINKIPSIYISSIRMGTTIATNALLEKKGKKTALLINEGFKDLLIIGTQQRPKIFDFEMKRSENLFEKVIEIKGRLKKDHLGDIIGIDGEKFKIIEDLDQEIIEKQLKTILNEGITSLAVVLMFSYSFPNHELEIEKIAKKLGFENVSLSHKVSKMPKIVSRGYTTVLDAYLNPKVSKYIEEFISEFDSDILLKPILFMQSDGGLRPIHNFHGSKALLSGPAGGVIGYSKTTENTGNYKGIIGLDMGGTSTDVSRFDLINNNCPIIFETEIAGTPIQSPHLDIHTVAAGGGSRLFYENNTFIVGPESAGALPGPICYGNKGYLAITDANLILGRIRKEYFPNIFGKNKNEPLFFDNTIDEFEQIAKKINSNGINMSIYDIAIGFIKVANENMSRPIRNLTQNRGIDPREYILNVFGGAGGQHACSIAKNLGIKTIFMHKYGGILSAYGLSLADIVEDNQIPSLAFFNEVKMEELNLEFLILIKKNTDKLIENGFHEKEIINWKYLGLRFEGTDTTLMIKECNEGFENSFLKEYEREFGFVLKDRKLIIDCIRVRSFANKNIINEITAIITEEKENNITPISIVDIYFEDDENINKLLKLNTPIYNLNDLIPYTYLFGPALILNETSTIVIETNWKLSITGSGNMKITRNNLEINTHKKVEILPKDPNPIELAIFSNRFMSIAEQMGNTLQRTSISTNIKERLDFSCAIFSPNGSLVANAPHLPVHLGSMQEAVKFQINYLKDDWKQNDVILSNHPAAGGSHLPDITVISPVWIKEKPAFYVASRGHHADIGGITPGSMPAFSKSLEDEGTAVISMKLVKNGEFQEDHIRELFKASRCLNDNVSDLKAQIAANYRGIHLLKELIQEYSLEYVHLYMDFIQLNAEECVRNMLVQISLLNGFEEIQTVKEIDYMDDGTQICLSLTIDRKKRSAIFDFSGTGYQVLGNTNSPRAVVFSAIIYCLRCLIDKEIPLNQGCLNPITVFIPDKSILSPSDDAAIVGGNVLTSQRVTDVVLKAFRICGASQGCMNNVTFGNQNFSYYETIGGGAGAGRGFNGQNGIHSHMTNTKITDPEIFEKRYPVLLKKFHLRNDNSGGKGLFSGGEGIVREFQFLTKLNFSILSERRTFSPWGMNGGGEGKKGINLLKKNGTDYWINIGGKNTIEVSENDIIDIITPGGGAYGVSNK